MNGGGWNGAVFNKLSAVPQAANSFSLLRKRMDATDAIRVLGCSIYRRQVGLMYSLSSTALGVPLASLTDMLLATNGETRRPSKPHRIQREASTVSTGQVEPRITRTLCGFMTDTVLQLETVAIIGLACLPRRLVNSSLVPGYNVMCSLLREFLGTASGAAHGAPNLPCLLDLDRTHPKELCLENNV